MSGAPKTVGVCVPTHNDGPALARCLDSLLNQTHSISKIVVCDDASSDNTKELVEKYQAQNPGQISYIRHQPRVGHVKNFNSGIASLNTEYISIVAGDDYWAPVKIESEIKALAENPDCRWAYSLVAISKVKENNKIKILKKPRGRDGAQGDILFEVLLHDMFLRNWLIERSLLESVGLFDTNLKIFEDWEFKIRLAAASKIAHVPEYNIFYTKDIANNRSLSNRFGLTRMRSVYLIYYRYRHLIKKYSRSQRLEIKASKASFHADQIAGLKNRKNFGQMVIYHLFNLYFKFRYFVRF